MRRFFSVLSLHCKFYKVLDAVHTVLGSTGALLHLPGPPAGSLATMAIFYVISSANVLMQPLCLTTYSDSAVYTL